MANRKKENFNSCRMIRMKKIPKMIDIHFVENESIQPGWENLLSHPIFAAVANALYKATGKHFCNQPFINGMQENT